MAYGLKYLESRISRSLSSYRVLDGANAHVQFNVHALF